MASTQRRVLSEALDELRALQREDQPDADMLEDMRREVEAIASEPDDDTVARVVVETLDEIDLLLERARMSGAAANDKEKRPMARKGLIGRDDHADGKAIRERLMERVNRALDQLEPIEAALSNVTRVVADARRALDLQRAQMLLREIKPCLDTVIYFLGQADEDKSARGKSAKGKSAKGYPPYDTMRDRP